MADPSDFAYTPPSQSNAYGPGGGWTDDQGSGYVFMRNPQQDMAAAQKRAADADTASAAAVRARRLAGTDPVFGRSDADLADAAAASRSANADVNRIADFQRRKGAR